MTDGDIVLRLTSSNFNKIGPRVLFFPPNIVSITISCNDELVNFFPIVMYLPSLLLTGAVGAGVGSPSTTKRVKIFEQSMNQ